MQDIADAAGVNKALVHYYFRNKKQLFKLIFEEKFYKLFGTFRLIVLSDKSFEEKIRDFVREEISIISELPSMPLFVLNELHQNPNMIMELMQGKPLEMIRTRMRQIFQQEIEEGRVKPMAFEQFMMNMVALCIFPILARPMFQFILELDDEQYWAMIEARKQLVADTLLQSILTEPNQ